MKFCTDPLLRLLLFLPVLAPTLAAAQIATPPPMAIWPSRYQPIEAMPGGADSYLLLWNVDREDGDQGVAESVQLPFGFRLLGSEPFHQFNVGANGYIIFGGVGGAHSAALQTAADLVRTTTPRELIAAWWGNHFCTANGGVRTKTLGTAPERRFVIEWGECSKKKVDAKAHTEITFQTQIWLYEGSNVVRVHYGRVAPDVAPKWPAVSWGIKGTTLGFLGPSQEGVVPICEPAGPKDGRPQCGGEHFPQHSVIQYGLGPGVDLAGRLLPDPPVLGPTQLELTSTTTLLNVGDQAAEAVGYELYLMPSLTSDAGPGDASPVFTRPAEVALAGGGSTSFRDSFLTSRPANGSYRVCMQIDPGAALGEVDRTNNWLCAHQRFSVGPDLVAVSVTAPPRGRPGGTASVTAELRNIGDDDAGAFSYRLLVEPEGSGSSSLREEILVGRIGEGLAAGQSRTLALTADLPRILRADAYRFVLELDHLAEVADADRLNNSARSAGAMANDRPHLKITTPVYEVELPQGCFYGEEISATFEVCNIGKADASAFRPAVMLGDEFQLNLADDVPAASFPPYCGVPGTRNYTPCEPTGSLESSCILEFCRAECERDDQCGPGLSCAEDPYLSAFLGRPATACVNRLPFAGGGGDSCRTFTMKGRLPLEDQHGTPRTKAQQYFHVIDDVLRSTSQPLPDVVTLEPILCRPALLDLAAVSLEPVGRLIAGKEIWIHRRIDNEGFTNPGADGEPRPEREAFTYRYYLATTPEVSVHQIPLPVLGEVDGVGKASIERRSSDVAIDRVSIPAGVAPGTYHLALLVDPEGALQELDKENNLFVASLPVEVEPAALTIVTERLPKANLGAHYSHSLVAKGGLGAYSWSTSSLPPGMRLSGSGLLYGSPTEVGSFALPVRVQAAGDSVERLLSLQILPGQSELEIATRTLPLAVKGEPYARWHDPSTTSDHDGIQLVASGGTPPYRWALDPASELPEGIEGPDPDGRIAGQATVRAQSSRFLVHVQDAQGNANRSWLEIVVIDEETLAILGDGFPLATSGNDYHGCVEARGGAGTYAWTADEGSLPKGLELEATGTKACLRGVPTVCGNFVVGLQLSDDLLRSATAAVPLGVECGPIQLRAPELRPLFRGEEVQLQLGAVPSTDEPTFRLLRGALPAGLSLREDGLLSGTVAADAAYGSHDTILELRDEVGRRSLSALTVRVEIDVPPRATRTRSASGCGSGGAAGAPSTLLLLLPVALLPWLRRNASRPGAPSRGAPAGGGRTAGAASSRALPTLFVASALLASLGGGGCGGEEVTVEEARCATVSCEPGFECDEADGQCKCGGEVCESGERCELDPSPSCVSSACAHVRCERGQSCHPVTGACLCGEASCGEEEWCVEGSCVAADRCADSGCGAGTICDPEDGQCRCGSSACDPGIACVEGRCEVDRCSGVSCGINSVCNPEDGGCHCGGVGGDVCSTGEACLPVEDDEGSLACAPSSLCDDVICYGGTVCDPEDGLCRCGGLGTAFPVCATDQSCLDGQCRGGDLCAPGGVPRVCDPGLDCDPTDGVCKCGGKGGSVCGDEEGCTLLAGDQRCTPFCTLLAASPQCGASGTCYFDPEQAHGRSFCAPRGSRLLNDTCEGPTDCGQDLFCTRAGRCALLCSVDDGPEYCHTAGQTLDCVPFSIGGDFGYCRAL